MIIYPTPRYKNGLPVLASPTINLLLIKFSVSLTIKVLWPSSLSAELKRSITKVSSSLNSTPHSPAISLTGSVNCEFAATKTLPPASMKSTIVFDETLPPNSYLLEEQFSILFQLKWPFLRYLPTTFGQNKMTWSYKYSLYLDNVRSESSAVL